MTEPKQTPIGSDDLHLAQLACAKLVGLIRGTLSIGLPAFVTGVPDPRAFLHDRFRVVTAFALVLDAICWPAGNVQEILHLREKSGKLLSALEDLRRQLLSALDDTGPVLSRLQPAQKTALALFDAIGEYAALVRLDRAPILEAKSAVMGMFDVMARFDPRAASSAR